MHVDWGTFSLVAALKELIMSGLEDRLNQKFMLISESGIPLYPGETMWVELMVEEKSRINACELGVSPLHPLPLFILVAQHLYSGSAQVPVSVEACFPLLVKCDPDSQSSASNASGLSPPS